MTFLSDCNTCPPIGPDEFGMYDSIPLDECPWHGVGDTPVLPLIADPAISAYTEGL